MIIVFRTDASTRIGGGHLMRCLTLAEALTASGAECHFLCRAQPGNLIALVRQRGFAVTTLGSSMDTAAFAPAAGVRHAEWLECDWRFDAQQSEKFVSKMNPHWLVVDHYALDHLWERALKPHCQKMMVIDDLADRAHVCDLLLDQNLGRDAQDYMNLVPAACKVLAGARYALLRPEYATARARSLERRKVAQLKQLLISMGSVDVPNATGAVLDALRECAFSRDFRIVVVMGKAAPWLAQVSAQARNMPWPTDVVVNTSEMANIMSASDLAIGAAGGTAWERCCLGLPALIVILAENQARGAHALHAAGAGRLIGAVDDISTELPLAVAALLSSTELIDTARRSSMITDGGGVERVLAVIGAPNE